MSRKIRGLDPKFQSFLWAEVSKIREAETDGRFGLAMERATSLIDYLPEDAKKAFQKKAKEIQKALLYLSGLDAGTDIFTASIVRHRRIQKASSMLLHKFMNKLTSYWDERGYMENRVKDVPTGSSRTVR